MKDVKGSEADIPKLRQFRRENDKMCDELNFSISSDDIKCGPAEAKENRSTLKHRAEHLIASHDDVNSAETKEGVKKEKLDIGLLNREGKRHNRAHGNKGKIKMKAFPMSGIQVFKQWEYQGVVKELGSSNTEVVNKELLRRWSCKGEADRKPFEDIAENNRRTQNEMMKFNIPSIRDNSPNLKSKLSHKSAAKSRNQMKRKKSKLLDPSAPKRPPSAYFDYAAKESVKARAELMSKDNFSPKNLAIELGRRWKSLSDEEKAPYQAKAQERMKIYLENRLAYDSEKTSKEGQMAKARQSAAAPFFNFAMGAWHKVAAERPSLGGNEVQEILWQQWLVKVGEVEEKSLMEDVGTKESIKSKRAVVKLEKLKQVEEKVDANKNKPEIERNQLPNIQEVRSTDLIGCETVKKIIREENQVFERSTDGNVHFTETRALFNFTPTTPPWTPSSTVTSGSSCYSAFEDTSIMESLPSEAQKEDSPEDSNFESLINEAFNLLPPAPRTAYSLFCDQLKEKVDDGERLWASLPEDDRRKYKEQAEVDKKRYLAEALKRMEGWKD